MVVTGENETPSAPMMTPPPRGTRGQDDDDGELLFGVSALDDDFRLDLFRRLRLQASPRFKCTAAPIVESYPILTPGQEQGQELHPPQLRSLSFHRHQLLEIFAVILLDNLEPCGLEADIVVKADKRDYVLWNKINGQITAEGDFILTGPNCSIGVPKAFSLYPCYWSNYDLTGAATMWSSPQQSSDPKLNSFQSNYVTTKSNILEVRFAVYDDGVEIQLEAVLSDLNWESFQDVVSPLRVYGSVMAYNDVITHYKAKSALFDHTTDHVILNPPDNRGNIILPLTRSVIAVPRNSSLLVDVCLYVWCGNGGTCIANSTVIFSARTRCDGFAEEAIIHGNNGKVKLKAVWVENEKNKNRGNVEQHDVEQGGEKNINDEERRGEADKAQGVEQEEYDGKEEQQEGSVASEGSYQMDTADESYRDISDEKSSFRLPKVPRLNLQEDVSSRASEYSPTESSDTEVQEVEESLEASSPWRYHNSLLELFSVKFVEFEKLDVPQIYGFILLRTGNPLYYVFRRVRGDPLLINSKGFVMLEGPNLHAIRVLGDIVLDPLLFKYEVSESNGDDTQCTLLWNENNDRHYFLDTVLQRIAESQFGPLEIKYIVYRDGVEAHLKVVLTECCFSSVEIHGEITATNSAISDSGVSSMLFYREKDQAIKVHVRPGEEMVLPLYKSMIALPYKSNLTLDLAIKAQDDWFVHGPVNFVSLAIGENYMSLPGNGCTVQVVVDYGKDVRYQ